MVGHASLTGFAKPAYTPKAFLFMTATNGPTRGGVNQEDGFPLLRERVDHL